MEIKCDRMKHNNQKGKGANDRGSINESNKHITLNRSGGSRALIIDESRKHTAVTPQQYNRRLNKKGEKGGKKEEKWE